MMAVAFQRHGRLYYLDPGDVACGVGDWVLVPTGSGPEVAQCVWIDREAEFPGELPRCAGLAEVDDLARDAANATRRAEILAVAAELVRTHGLPMRIVGVDYLDRGTDFDIQSVVYFAAPGRVDFRALLGDLARALRSRIDLRQVGPRDAAALLGGVAPCGREFCCAVRGTVPAVTPRQARAQNLSPNPAQLAGACGRLMCCVAYEADTYEAFSASAPSVGESVSTPEGTGVVIGHVVPADALDVRLKAGVQRCSVSSCARMAPRGVARVGSDLPTPELTKPRSAARIPRSRPADGTTR